MSDNVKQDRPAPICGTGGVASSLSSDCGDFVRTSVLERLPTIFETTCELNAKVYDTHTLEQIRAMAQTIRAGGALTLPDSHTTDGGPVWTEWLSKTSRPEVHKGCLDMPWFLLENLAYRKLLHITKYWQDTNILKGLDPFKPQKESSLRKCLSESPETFLEPFINGTDAMDWTTQQQQTTLSKALLASLWGNWHDLSISSGAVVSKATETTIGSNTDDVTGELDGIKDDMIIVDDRTQVWQVLSDAVTSLQLTDSFNVVATSESTEAADDAKRVYMDEDKDNESTKPSICARRSRKNVRVVIVLDNCGPELLQDLRLVDVLLELFNGSLVVELHAKTHPVFVSDALIADIITHIVALENFKSTVNNNATTAHMSCAHSLASRLRAHLASDRLVLKEHAFYTSPLPFWDMPEDLRSCLGSATLCVTKGDANYRRLLGDRGWEPAQTEWQKILEYWPSECAVLAVRTCKSPVLVGVADDVLERVRAINAKWLVDGSAGLLQLRIPLK